ncbi:hypothetical protein QSH18_17930 [Xanthomonas sp. NCPPB 2654]|uniref:hypothetical protein n=1 Tax=unclassified Xanthomonas TaxID=2643310 RepID=UPI0021DF6F26|nr:MULTISPECIES: hypothetical protein [unclassified Xanthomonas]MDL5367493.1 hypothetical protein [Xanthomonas sp. NCPPB 2654]UYC22543.1 hypothetical protein NUG20_09815 [Xanthomonas sp. CFBP 8443]
MVRKYTGVFFTSCAGRDRLRMRRRPRALAWICGTPSAWPPARIAPTPIGARKASQGAARATLRAAREHACERATPLCRHA